MSFVHSEAKGDFAQGFQKSYISTRAFNGEFQTYTTSMNANFQTVGTLSAVAAASAANCPANRVLHFTGRKLVPGQHPNVSKMLVSVYDPVSFLNGFIDPSSSAFAKYDQNMPNSFNDGRNGSSVPPLGGQGGKVTVADAGVLTAPTATGAATLLAGNASVGAITIPVNSAVGTHTITVTSSAVTSSSRIFISNASVGTGNLTSFYLSSTADGSFVVVAVVSTNVTGAAVIFNWLVVN